MLHDLQGAGERTEKADVLLIGAGTVGLPMAVRLAEMGFKVICLESGGHRQDAEEHPLNAVVQERAVYGGAAHGRFRCLGGTSTRWGGALIPFARGDLAGHDWPINHEDIVAWLAEVERFFGLSTGPYELPDVMPPNADHIARLAKWPPFAKRNVAHLLAAPIRASDGPDIWLNATATDFAQEDGQLRHVVARSADGSSLTVQCRHAVIAAGAIETTRLLLLMDAQTGSAVTQGHDQLGRYFHDHLSVVVGEILPTDRRRLNRLFGFRFEKGGAMRNLRFELTDDTNLRRTLPACFAHIAFEEKAGSGFDALRALLRNLQQRRLPTVPTFLALLRGAPWLARAVWWRFIEKRLLYPSDVAIQVHMVIEQQPDPANRIRLSPDARDDFGQPLASIDWAPSALDTANLTKATDAFEQSWHSSPLAGLGRFVRRSPGEAEAALSLGEGIFHPGGSTRMASEPAGGPVGPDLRLFGIRNVTVAATSVLPTGGGANPTMMLMMLGFRAVHDIAAGLSQTMSEGAREIHPVMAVRECA
jgi:choline dehydrogenase-like flavoprotein